MGPGASRSPRAVSPSMSAPTSRRTSTPARSLSRSPSRPLADCRAGPLTRALGPRPQAGARREACDQGAQAIASYRDRYQITSQQPGVLGPEPRSIGRHHQEWEQAVRQVLAAPARARDRRPRPRTRLRTSPRRSRDHSPRRSGTQPRPRSGVRDVTRPLAVFRPRRGDQTAATPRRRVPR